MRVIGITGGVGCGKSEVLDFLAKNYNCMIIKSDEVAWSLEEPGRACFEQVTSLLESAKRYGDGDLFSGHNICFDRKEAAARMYRDPELVRRINDVVHPAVNKYIKDMISEEDKKNEVDYFFIEAALLIENGYKAIVDEMWYIYCPEELRRGRLQKSRGYSDDKINAIMAAQLSDKEFRDNCDMVIDNGGSIESMRLQVSAALSTINSKSAARGIL